MLELLLHDNHRTCVDALPHNIHLNQNPNIQIFSKYPANCFGKAHPLANIDIVFKETSTLTFWAASIKQLSISKRVEISNRFVQKTA